MIQKAHVGVGIAGVEGLQAASNADYAFGQVSTVFILVIVNYHYYALLFLCQ